MRQLVLDILAPRVPTLAHPIAGLESLAAEGRLAEPVLYLWGEPGAGRTHLLRAAAAFGVVVADDVDALDDAAQVSLFNRINEARVGACRVIAAGPAAPAHLALRDDLRSRLGGGLVYQLHPLTDDDKAEYLRAEGARRGLGLGDDVVAYLLTHARRDLPFLEALLEHLDRHALEQQRRVTVPLVRETLGHLDP